MNSPARSVQIFAIYLAVMGVGLVALPGTIIPIFGLPAPADVWVRVTGMVALLLAYYYFQAGRENVVQFMRWSIPARVSVPVFFAAFVLLGYAQPPLLIFGVVDLLGALWTWYALRSA